MASPDERTKLIDQFMPARDGVATEGFAVDAKLFGQLVNTASRLGDELHRDPATYVASRSSLCAKRQRKLQAETLPPSRPMPRP